MAEVVPMVPPHSVEAEQSVIGALLLDNRAYERIGDLLTPADFYLHQHRAIYAACADLIIRGRPADVITVHERLRSLRQDEDAGGMMYLHDVLVSVAGASNVTAYAAIVRQRSRRRRLMQMGQDLIDQARDMAGDDAQLDSLIDRSTLGLLGLMHGTTSDEPKLLSDLLPAWLDALDDRAQGKTDAIPTGLADVDKLLAGGMRRGEVIVIGARPSMGKSALMLTIARNVSRVGPVLACSMEDSEQMLVSRQVAAAGRVNLADIRSPERAGDAMWTRVADAVELLKPLMLHIDDRPALALKDVRRKSLQVKRRAGDLVLVVVDYLQLMEGEGETRAYELAAIARGLKRLAKELNCAVMLLSQLSREADKLEGPPRIDHLAESGGIEQAADIIGLLWREARRKPKPDNKHKAQIEFAKNKNGPTDTVKLYFDGATQRFEDTMEVSYG